MRDLADDVARGPSRRPSAGRPLRSWPCFAHRSVMADWTPALRRSTSGATVPAPPTVTISTRWRNWPSSRATRAGFPAWLSEQLSAPGEADGVTLASIHAVKGREWLHVVVHHVTDGLLPHRLPEDIEEERRIFHVALTRCRRSASIIPGSPPSPFLLELDAPGVPDSPWPGSRRRAGRPVTPGAGRPGWPDAAVGRHPRLRGAAGRGGIALHPSGPRSRGRRDRRRRRSLARRRRPRHHHWCRSGPR